MDIARHARKCAGSVRGGTVNGVRASILILLVVVAVSGCAGRAAAPDRAPRAATSAGIIPVVASFYPLYEFAARIGGEHASVRMLVPAGAEPHDYEPTARDVARLMAAKMLVYNGAGFEPSVEKLAPSLPGTVVKVNATAGLPLVEADAAGEPRRAGENRKAAFDPHVWLDPVLARRQADNILAGFVQADPAHRTAYEQHATELKADLGALDARYRRTLQSCRRRVIITNHASFGYLAGRYGLTMLPISGLSPEAEPSPARLKEIVRLARQYGVRIIYFETLVSPRVAETIAREIGAQTRVLNPLEGLNPEEQRRGAAYVRVMDENLRALADGLDCR